MRCSFRLDADGPSPDGPAAPFDVVAWDEQGEEVALSLGRGRLVAVEGMLQDGSEEGIPEICATSVQALDGEDEERGEGTPVPVVPEISTNAHMLPQRSAPAEHTSPF
jgi:single-stranded DNA-binding protein